MSDKPIFYDASGRRALGASVAGWIAGVVSLILGAAFAATLAYAPALRTKAPYHFTAISIADLEKAAKAPGLVRAAARLGAEARARREQRARELLARNERGLHSRPLFQQHSELQPVLHLFPREGRHSCPAVRMSHDQPGALKL